MNKKIITIFFLIIVSFFLFNYKKILWNYYFMSANKEYELLNYSWALINYNNSYKYLSWTNLDYNIANTYYKIWEKQKIIDNQYNFYKKSLENYLNIITKKDFNVKDNNDVVYNYVYVKNKLEKIEKEKKDNEEKQKTDELNKKQNEKNQKNKDEEQKKSDKWDEKGEANVSNTNELNDYKNIELSNQEILDISNYVERLIDEEKYNRQFYNNFWIQNQPINQFNNNIDQLEKDW